MLSHGKRVLIGFMIKSGIIVFFKQVHQVATDQVFETFSHLGHKKSLPALRNAAASGSSSQLESLANVFTQDAKRLQEVSELHTSLLKPLLMTTSLFVKHWIIG